MEILVRKYLWAVELGLLALASVLGAITVNSFVASALVPPVDLDAMAPAPRASSRPVLGRPGSLSLEKTAAFLGITLPEEVPDEATPDEPAFDPNAEAVPSSLNVTLVGTMVANRPEWSFATIRGGSGSDASVYLVGDEIEGAEIIEIDRLRVILNNQGRKEFISIEGAKPAEPKVTSSPPVATRRGRSDRPEPVDAEVRQVDDSTYEISREDVEKQLSNLSALATQARVIPNFKDGQANGFKIFSIRPGSIYQKLGLQNGDVIRKINGYAIDSPEKALEIYAKLKESSRIEVELERRGSVSTRALNVR